MSMMPSSVVDGQKLELESELRSAVACLNATRREFASHETVHGLVRAQAVRTPNRVAVGFEGRSLTYAELDEASDRLARCLAEAGLGPGKLGGVCVERTHLLPVSVLGVLKTGAAYVPIDHALPRERIQWMFEDAGIAAVVTQTACAGALPDHQARTVWLEEDGAMRVGHETERSAGVGGSLSLDAADRRPLAYVIFTSGSTGRPKGVRISHRSVVNFLASMRREPGFGEDDVMLAITTLSFDIAGLELFLPLTTGGKVVVVGRATASDPERLRAEMERSGATVMQATPTTWRMLQEAGWPGAGRLKVLVGGEAVPRDLTNWLAPRCASVWNMYGPTETTIWSTVGRVDSGEGPMSIGRPIDNTRVYVVGPGMDLVPIGEVGELVIGGEGVAEGYLNRPELTAERFVEDRHSEEPEARMFRTGDLGRWRSDGTLECLGRLDDQIKIRGFRIEQGEVESALRAHPKVRAAAVAVREAGPGDPRLVGYLVPRDGNVGVDVADVRESLRKGLPEYMIPTQWMVLDRLPQTPNGKLDRRALPTPDVGQVQMVAGAAFVEPRTAEERKMVGVWSSVLKARQVGMHDSFFALGGHSLLAVQLFGRIEKEFGRRLPLTTLLRHSTPAAVMAQLATAGDERGMWGSLVTMQGGRTRPPLFCIHGAGGNVLLYRELIAALGSDVGFHGFQSRGLDGAAKPLATIEEMASAYVAELRDFQPRGPYALGGYCMGGTVAYEMARQLSAAGESVAFLALFDTYNFAARTRRSKWIESTSKMVQKGRFHATNLVRAGRGGWWRYLSSKVGRLTEAGSQPADTMSDRRGVTSKSLRTTLRLIESMNHEAAMNYRPSPSVTKLTVFRPTRNYACYPDPEMGWGSLASAGLEVVRLPLDPHAMLVEPYVGQLARALRARLAEAGVR